MGGPASVAEAGRAHRRLAIQSCLELLDLAQAPPDHQPRAVQHRQPRRVIAAVLEPLQPVEYAISGVPLSDIADNSTHGVLRFPQDRARRYQASLRAKVGR